MPNKQILKGDRELQSKLKAMAKGVQNKILRQALRKGMAPVEALAKQRAPVESGRLQKSIKVASYRGKRGVVGASVRTGTRRQLKIMPEDDFYYPAAHEYGSKNQRAKSFMRSALFDRKRQALSITEKEMVKYLLTFKVR